MKALVALILAAALVYFGYRMPRSAPEMATTTAEATMPPSPSPAAREFIANPAGETETTVHGRVLQVIPEGVLVDCGDASITPSFSGMGRIGGGSNARTGAAFDGVKGTILLTGSLAQGHFAEGDYVKTTGVITGTFRCRDVQGATRTFRVVKVTNTSAVSGSTLNRPAYR